MGRWGKRSLQSSNVGQIVPNTTLSYVPWTQELESHKACGVPTTFKTHDEWKGKKVVVVSVPGAFTPTWCVLHAGAALTTAT